MKVRLLKYVYVRSTEEFGYIADMLTGKQITLDGSGSVLISHLTHDWRDTDEMVNDIVSVYSEVYRLEIQRDLESILHRLHDEKLIEIYGEPNEPDCLPRKYTPENKNIPHIEDLTIEITNACNERCIHCYLPDSVKDRSVSLNVDEIIRIINEFVELGGKSVTLTGGEVFLHKDIRKIIRHITSVNLQYGLYSNLVLLTDRHLDFLCENRPCLVQVSLYAMQPDIHDAITKIKGSWQRSMNAIAKLRQKGIPVKIACPVMRENASNIVELIKFAQDTDIEFEPSFVISARCDQSDDNLVHRLSAEEFDRMVKTLLLEVPTFAKEYFMRKVPAYTVDYDFIEFLNSPLCPAGHLGLYVTAGGDITVCPQLQGQPIGDIFGVTLKEIWEKSEWLKRLRSLTNGCFETCMDCTYSDFCHRCYAVNHTETGSILKIPKEICEQARILWKNLNTLRECLNLTRIYN